jgi:hypothetical protein
VRPAGGSAGSTSAACEAGILGAAGRHGDDGGPGKDQAREVSSRTQANGALQRQDQVWGSMVSGGGTEL